MAENRPLGERNSFAALSGEDPFETGDVAYSTFKDVGTYTVDSDSEVDEVMDMSDKLSTKPIIIKEALPLAMFLMYSIASWNIRGMNQSPKQKEVRQVLGENKLSICAILESHVSNSRLQVLCVKVFRRWDWTSNGHLCDKGSRIMN